MTVYNFPGRFLWGTATAAAQIEGAAFEDGKGVSIWDDFSCKPGTTLLGHTPTYACDHYHRYEEDLDLLAKLGIRAYRFSISWPRILPDGRGVINQKGLDFYNRLIDGLLKRDIVPFVTLYHWDLPLALEKEGGWRVRKTVHAFEKYTCIMVETLGDRVEYWATFNEMPCIVDLGYRTGRHAPGAREPEKIIRQVNHHVLLAHGLGLRAIRSSAGIKPQAGIVSNPAVGVPFFEEKQHIDAARSYFAEINAWMLDPIYRGCYPEIEWDSLGNDVPDVEDGDLEIIAEPMDFIGINLYSPGDVVHASRKLDFPEEHAPSTDMKWPIITDCLYWASRFIHEIYQPEDIYITESGCAFPDDVNKDGNVDDISRIEYLKNHLKGVHRAVEEDIPVKGYFVWSFMDNFEWAYGYTKRFGLVFVNYESFQRIPKLSFDWYSSLIRNNGF